MCKHRLLRHTVLRYEDCSPAAGDRGHCSAATGHLPRTRVSPTLTDVSQTYYRPVLSNGAEGKLWGQAELTN